jgi:hypothetical protein
MLYQVQITDNRYLYVTKSQRKAPIVWSSVCVQAISSKLTSNLEEHFTSNLAHKGRTSGHTSLSLTALDI